MANRPFTLAKVESQEPCSHAQDMQSHKGKDLIEIVLPVLGTNPLYNFLS